MRPIRFNVINVCSIMLALAGFLMMAVPLRAAVLLSDDFSDGLLNGPGNTGPEWTMTQGTFSIYTAAQSTDGKELGNGEASSPSMKTSIGGAPGNLISLDLHVRYSGPVTQGGKVLYFDLVDSQNNNGLGFSILLSRRNTTEKPNEQVAILSIASTLDGGATNESLHSFPSLKPDTQPPLPSFDGSDNYQHVQFLWNRGTGDIAAYFNGINIGTYTYTGVNTTFDAMVVSGYKYLRLDDFTLSNVPEPAGSMMGVLLGGLLLVRRRRL